MKQSLQKAALCRLISMTALPGHVLHFMGRSSRDGRDHLDGLLILDKLVRGEQLVAPDDQDRLRIDFEFLEQIPHPPAAGHLDLAAGAANDNLHAQAPCIDDARLLYQESPGLSTPPGCGVQPAACRARMISSIAILVFR